MKLLKYLLGVVVLFLAFFVFFAMIVQLLSWFDLLPRGSILQMLTFIPARALALVVLLVAVVGWIFRWRKFVFGLVFLTTLYCPVCGDYSARSFLSYGQPASAGKRLSVATLNERYFFSGAGALVDAVKTMDADVVLLSENVLGRRDLDLVTERFKPYKFMMGKQFETAIATRLPVLSFREVLFPSHQASLSLGNEEKYQAYNSHRAFTHAVVDVGGVRVNVLSVRLIAGRAKDKTLSENLAWGWYLFRVQLGEVLFLRQYVESLQGPVVFAGDMNATPPSRIVRDIAAFASDMFLDSRTFGRTTFPSYNRPGVRLDYIFGRNGVRAAGAEVLNLSVSDHFPVRADLVISNQ